MLLDRHRVARLVELSALERTVKGPERELREEDVRIFLKAAYDDASEAARAEFMARVQKMPTSAWPWSAVLAMAPRSASGGGIGGLIAVPKPASPTVPAALVLLRGQADSPDVDPGNRLPARGTPEAAEWEPLYKALDAWDTQALTKAIGPLGWVSMLGSTAGQVPKDTGDATSGAPAAGPGPEPSPQPAPPPSPAPADLPTPQPPATPATFSWTHPAVIAAGAAAVVTAGALLYTLGQAHSRRRLEDVLASQEEPQ